MTNNIKISVNIPLDEESMIGRECPKCKKYFKIKPGTGLPTTYCHCPYCDYEGEAESFWTSAQIEYAKSIAINQALKQIIKPSLEKLTKLFKDLERKTKNSLIQFKVKTSDIPYTIPIKYYTEKELETTVTCDNCGLVFSVYGVFAQCPNCNEINAFLMYEKSLEATQKQLEIVKKPNIPKEIRENSLIFILSSCVSAFDALGKELRKRKPDLYPKTPKNLFQNLYKLNQYLDKLIETEHSNFAFLIKLFQVRHLYEHNMAVIDNDFIQKIPSYKSELGKKYILTEKEITEFIFSMKELGEIIKKHFKTVDKKST